AKAPGERYPDGHAFAEDLSDVLASRPPRHHKGWTAPVRGESTIVSASDDEVSQILAEHLEPLPDTADGRSVPPLAAAPPPQPPVARARSSSRPVRLLTLGMLLVGLTAYYLSIESPERLARIVGFVAPAALPEPPFPVTAAGGPPASAVPSPA